MDGKKKITKIKHIAIPATRSGCIAIFFQRSHDFQENIIF